MSAIERRFVCLFLATALTYHKPHSIPGLRTYLPVYIIQIN